MGFTLTTPDKDYRINSLAALSPAVPEAPGTFAGLGSAVGTSAVGAVGDVARTAADTLTSSSQANAALGLTENPFADPTGEGLAQLRSEAPQKPLFDEQLTQLHEWSRLDPTTQGGGSRLLGSTVHGLTVFGAGTLLGGPIAGAGTLAATEGYNTLRDTQAQGVDQTTALKMAGLTGATSFAGAFLPLKIGGGAATSLAGLGMRAEIAGNEALASTLYGTARAAATAATNTGAKLGVAATINAGFGVADRYASSSILNDAGYKDMAAQYQPLDSEALAADLILGAAFGLHGHLSERPETVATEAAKPPPSLIESALASRRQEMVARGGAGIPIDPMHANLDVTLQDNALSDLLHGRDVNVAPEHAAEIIQGAVPDLVRREVNDAFIERAEEQHGLLADFSEPARQEVTRPEIPAPLPEQPRAEGEQAPAAAISDLSQESLRQLAAGHPDMQVELGNGQSVAAADLPKLMAKELAQADADAGLHDVAMACFMRTQ